MNEREIRDRLRRAFGETRYPPGLTSRIQSRLSAPALEQGPRSPRFMALVAALLALAIVAAVVFIGRTSNSRRIDAPVNSGPTASSARTNVNCDPESGALPKRYGQAIAYDPPSGKVLLFGGRADTGSVYCDTWEWTGSNWVHLHPAHHPSERSFAYMAFDFQSNRMLLYGGGIYHSPDDPYKYDGWAWDGTDWRLLAENVQPALGTMSGMASAPTLGVFLLYPGDNIITTTASPVRRYAVANTYRWTGSGWLAASTTGPPSRVGPGFAYDPSLGAIVLFGGSLAEMGPGATDMWTWDGNSWTQLNPPGARPSGGVGSMTYDSARKVLVWFGEDGTWTWDGKKWTQRASVAQSPPYGNWGTLAYDPVHQQVLLAGMLQGDGYGRTYLWDGTAWTAH
jgi:hypothetical protein